MSKLIKHKGWTKSRGTLRMRKLSGKCTRRAKAYEKAAEKGSADKAEKRKKQWHEAADRWQKSAGVGKYTHKHSNRPKLKAVKKSGSYGY